MVFTPEQLQALRELALNEKAQEPAAEPAPVQSIDALKQQHEREIRKLTEKYENRLQGVEKKYFQDVEGLKKQIAQLHKKMGSVACGS